MCKIRETLRDWQRDWISANGETNDCEVVVKDNSQGEFAPCAYAGSFAGIPEELLDKRVVEWGTIVNSTVPERIGAYSLTVETETSDVSEPASMPVSDIKKTLQALFDESVEELKKNGGILSEAGEPYFYRLSGFLSVTERLGFDDLRKEFQSKIDYIVETSTCIKGGE